MSAVPSICTPLEEEGVDPPLGGAVEQLSPAIGEEAVLAAAQQGDAQVHRGSASGRVMPQPPGWVELAPTAQ